MSEKEGNFEVIFIYCLTFVFYFMFSVQIFVLVVYDTDDTVHHKRCFIISLYLFFIIL